MSQTIFALQTVPTTGKTTSLWKTLWRADAVSNLLIGDALLFLTPSVIDFMGMSDDTTTYLRGLGVFCVLYGLWQLWAARTGTISRFTFLIADLDMTVLGIGLIASVLLGVEFNTAGTLITLIFGGFGALLAAGLWYMASRQAP
jgi:hypothetical protein